MLPKLCLIVLLLALFAHTGTAQNSQSTADKIINFPSSFFTKVNKKTAALERRLTKQTEKYLHKLARKEARLQRKLNKVDSGAAKKCFASDPEQQYNALIRKFKCASGNNTDKLSGNYMPYIDSLQGALSFLGKNPDLLRQSKVLPDDVQKALSRLQQLQGKMQQADEIRQFTQQRKQNLKNQLAQYIHLRSGITNEFNNYSKEAHYYSQQLKEYKEILNDPDRAIKTALTVLNKVPAFTSFMKKNSMLASLFNIPGLAGNTESIQSATGLQTRDQVIQVFQNQAGAIGSNVNSMIRQNVQSAQGQVNTLKDKLNSLGGGGDGDMDMPNFKPNAQRTKTFFQRLEYGTNIQSVQSSYFFPTTTDLGLSVGYKLNNKSTIGLGASYKMGWGKDVQHINITHEGVGLRSFLDIKLKGSFYASGGFEYNYQQPFGGLLPPSGKDAASSWQQSGLLGISKILSLKTKMLKKSKLQFLWDFLSYQQRPQTQTFKFRIGYNF